MSNPRPATERPDGALEWGSLVLPKGHMMRKEPKPAALKPYSQGGPRTPGTEPDGVTNCRKCFGRGFVWKQRGKMRSAEPCSRCGGS